MRRTPGWPSEWGGELNGMTKASRMLSSGGLAAQVNVTVPLRTCRWYVEGPWVICREKEFVKTIAPHERAVMLLDNGSAAGQRCRRVLGRVAGKHLEAGTG